MESHCRLPGDGIGRAFEGVVPGAFSRKQFFSLSEPRYAEGRRDGMGFIDSVGNEEIERDYARGERI